MGVGILMSYLVVMQFCNTVEVPRAKLECVKQMINCVDSAQTTNQCILKYKKTGRN